MAKSRRPRLKVFQAQFGFYDTVVSAPNQAAALRAWGTHQNLFASGEARVATDQSAVAAALAYPEMPLRRPVGSSDPFELKPTNLPKIPDLPRRSAKAGTRSIRRPPPRRKVDRSKLEAAEAALRNLEERWKREEADFDREEEALKKRRTEAQSAYAKDRKAAMAAIAEARKALFSEAPSR